MFWVEVYTCKIVLCCVRSYVNTCMKSNFALHAFVLLESCLYSLSFSLKIRLTDNWSDNCHWVKLLLVYFWPITYMYIVLHQPHQSMLTIGVCINYSCSSIFIYVLCLRYYFWVFFFFYLNFHLLNFEMIDYSGNQNG